MAKYTVKGTDILYNGKLYPEGETISPDDETAIQLVDYLELIPEKSTGKQTKTTKETDTSSTTTADGALDNGTTTQNAGGE